jgi:hypothetical protein
MSKITKIQIKDFVKRKLANDPIWAQQALLKIFEFQTLDEQKSKDTIYHNGVGFNGNDGEILSSFALQFRKKKFLSDKQMAIVFKKMPKYWIQVVNISDEKKLHSLIQS